MTVFRQNYGRWFVLSVIICIVAGIFGSMVRAGNLFHLGFEFDTVETQFAWGRAAWDMGIFDFYQSYQGFFDYVPGNLVFLTGVFGISSWFGGSAQTFVVVLKLIAWLSEIILAIVVFLLGRKRIGHARALVAAACVYALPSLWFISGVWGQNDTLSAMISFASVWLAWQARIAEKPATSRRYALASGLVFTAALWFKLQAILMVPIIGFLLFTGLRWKDITRMLLPLVWLGVICLAGFTLYSHNDNLSARAVVSSGLIILSISLCVSIWKGWVQSIAWWWATAVMIGLTTVGTFFAYAGLDAFARGFFAPFNRADLISNGGLSLWVILAPSSNDASTPVISWSGIDVSISSISVMVFAVSVCVFIRRMHVRQEYRLIPRSLQDIQSMPQRLSDLRWSLYDTAFAIFFWSGIYFFFFTKMHSRYLHFSIIISIVLLSLNTSVWKSVSFWIGFCALHIGYFFNQLTIYQGWNPLQPWMNELRTVTPFNYERLAGAFLLVGFVLVTMEFWRVFKTSSSSLST